MSTSKDSNIRPYNEESGKVLLSDVLDRVLETGAVITGDITLGIANVDLVYCGIRIVLASVDTLEKSNKNDVE